MTASQWARCPGRVPAGREAAIHNKSRPLHPRATIIYLLHVGQPGRNGRHRHLHALPHGGRYTLAAKPIARAYLGSLRVRGDDEPLLDACLAASFAYMKPLTADSKRATQAPAAVVQLCFPCANRRPGV
jgi:hypothetical protein